jgi:hypothetical protein
MIWGRSLIPVLRPKLKAALRELTLGPVIKHGDRCSVQALVPKHIDNLGRQLEMTSNFERKTQKRKEKIGCLAEVSFPTIPWNGQRNMIEYHIGIM